MTETVDPEGAQKPTIGSVINAVPADMSQLSGPSTSSSKPASVKSDASFKSASSQVPTTTASTPPQPAQPTGPCKTPLTSASPSVKPPPPAPLTPEQQAKYATVLSTVSSWTTIPTTTAKGAPSAPITEDERMWLTRECLLRYLRATKWKVPDALKRLQSTLSWRREYGADTFTADYISPENETGKQVILGYDKDARPCLYLSPGKQNTKMSDRQIHHLSFMLDRVIDMMGPGQETTALLIDFDGAASGNVPTVGQARQVLNILQGHNPERLGRALISKLPWYVSTFFKLISPFIDPVTKEKMKFNEDLNKYIPSEQLWKAYGGELDFVYDHAVYWPALNEECTRRRQAYKERWIEAGKKVGEYEEYLRGGSQPSIAQTLDQAEKLSGDVQIDGQTVDIGKLKV
ncbi:Phosphatidylinositol transfer protein (PITP) [Zalaria obscura]|uniref:Phosphatidylinositol transfer protein (PITP) n=1 Tax=Zalaria obscura TaxID=2024903 RepID=A0ACC3SMW4_9PEZI